MLTGWRKGAAAAQKKKKGPATFAGGANKREVLGNLGLALIELRECH
jgi:hypothetical protein